MTAHSDRTEQYHAMKRSDANVQWCAWCGMAGAKTSMEPHHPAGRWGDDIFNYVWVHKHCHREIHQSPAAARDRGLLNAKSNEKKR